MNHYFSCIVHDKVGKNGDTWEIRGEYDVMICIEYWTGSIKTLVSRL